MEYNNGDEIWCLAMIDSTHRENDGEIHITIMKGTVTECDPFRVFAQNGLGEVITDENHRNCKNKNDAILEAIKWLAEIKE